VTLPKEIWDRGPTLTRRQTESFQPRKLRETTQVYDRKAVQEYLSGAIDREEMLRRIRTRS
jgi:hypothetical protein